jgi:RNA polymerase sigma-70 factor, ECF subfamily
MNEVEAINSMIQEGNKSAFEIIFRLHYSSLCAFATSFVSNTDDAQDIVQDLFFHIWIHRQTLPLDISLRAYLFTSTRNRCLNFLKHRKIVDTHREGVIKENMYIKYLDEYSEPNELHEKIRKTIDMLPPERRKILIMSKFESLKYREIAEKLNISVKTVENQMGKALQFLRKHLKDDLSVMLFIWGIIILINYIII